MRRYGDIIERVEIIRINSGLNKSQFAAAIGMKPQTYANFVGAQGSKPSIDLIYGVVRRFEVDPHWLLTGSGSMNLPQGGAGEEPGQPSIRSESLAGKVAAFQPAGGDDPAMLREVIQTLKELQVLIDRLQHYFTTDGQNSPPRNVN